MDRSYLSDENVVEASRDFVCIRLVTFEDEAEAEFLKTIYTDHGMLKNTVFGILSPDGKEKLTKTGRGPFFEYRGARDMARGMKKIAEKYGVKPSVVFSDTVLPFCKSLRLGLNVAAAEGRPLVVVSGKDQSEVDRISDGLVDKVWSEPLAGQFVYAAVTDAEDFDAFENLEPFTGTAIILPGQFGITGKTMAQFESDADPDVIENKMQEITKEFLSNSLDHRTHVNLGIDMDVDWQSEIPSTDDEANAAKRRARGK